MNQSIRVLLVDDHTIFRESLRRLLETDGRFQVIGECSTLEESLAMVEGTKQVDLALIDFQLSTTHPGRNGLAVVRAIRAAQPCAAVILLTAGAGKPELGEAVHTLSASIFLKSESSSNLFTAIERTLAGSVWISPAANQLLLEPSTSNSQLAPEAAFTARELVVLRHITEGLSNKEIADQLSITESGVKALLQRLFEKTSVRTRSQLVRYVFESGLTLP